MDGNGEGNAFFRDYANVPKKKMARGVSSKYILSHPSSLGLHKFFSWTGNNDTITTSNVATVLALLDSDG